jgi:acylglycerol lipase
MKHAEFYEIIPNCGSIYFQSWLPSDALKALMILVHGFGEHSSRYSTHFAEFYTSSNIGIISLDLPGHGRSFGKKGHITNPACLIEIIDLMIEKVKSDYPQIPLFLYGHSFGGEVILWYTISQNPSVNGVIVTSPLIGPKEAVPQSKLVLAKIMDKILPSFSMDNGINPNLLSRDPLVVKNYINDPLVHNQISARSGMMVINRGQWILDHSIENKNNILLMVGSNEGIVNNEAIDQFSRTAPNLAYKIWPGLYHEIHNEPEKKQVFDYSLKWIMKNI